MTDLTNKSKFDLCAENSVELYTALSDMVNEAQPLGISRPTYQAALVALDKIDTGGQREELIRLRGESQVLRGLLEAALEPLSTMMEDDDHYMVGAMLIAKIKLALEGKA